MFVADLQRHAEGLRATLAALDADALLGTQAVAALEAVTGMERSLAAARLALGHRVEETGAWAGRGETDASGWMARHLGTTRTDARRQLETAGRLAEQPRLAEALGAGDVSEAQAGLIAVAAAANPAATDDLLESAGRRSLVGLRQDCAAARAAVEDEQRRWARQRRARCARTWVDDDGMLNLAARFDPVVGARVRAWFEAATDQVFTEARREGRRDRSERYAADALERLICRGRPPAASADGIADAITSEGAPAVDDGTAGPLPPPGDASPVGRVVTELVLVADFAAMVRGFAEPGETVEIRGVGPVPVPVARALGWDAFIKLVVRDGVDVTRVAHKGRRCPAELRTALLLREPRCSNPGCDNRVRLDLDHTFVDYAVGGRLSLANTAPLCRGKGNCHDLKTRKGYRLEGPHGSRRWIHPDGTVLAADPVPAVDPVRADVADGVGPAALPDPPHPSDPPDPSGEPAAAESGAAAPAGPSRPPDDDGVGRLPLAG